MFLPIEGQRKTSFTLFLLFGTENILKNCEAGFYCFYFGEWEAFVGWWEVKLTLYNGHFLSEAPSHDPKYQPIIPTIKINPLKKVNSKMK